MLRLFIAVNCDDETKERLLSVQGRIKARSLKGNFTRPENLHLTLVFLGETPHERVSAICPLIKEAARPPVGAFTLDFTRAGCFTHSGKELWWVGAGKSDPSLGILTDIRLRLTGGLSAKGINYDRRSFNPHITLGREIKHNGNIVIDDVKITIPVNRINLMKSERIDGKLVYTEIFGADLGNE